MSNIVLTSPQGISGVPGTLVTNISIPGVGDTPNNVVVVDTSEGQSVKWIYTLIDNIDSKILTAEVLATQYVGSPETPNFNQYGIVGNLIQHTIEVKMIAATTIALEITNLQTNPLIANIIQIQTSSQP